MKNDTLTTVLNVGLWGLALIGVICAMLTMHRTREIRALTGPATMANSAINRLQALANDVVAYNQVHQDPNITRLLQSIQAKPAAK